jgi:superfamily I DNA/RNA helicase
VTTPLADFGGIPIVTVHAVKGETHDVTVFVVPPTAKKAAAEKCPSVVWWSDVEEDKEERRIAYVALTRSRGDVIFCVDEPAYDRLRKSQPAFIERFKCVSAADFLSARSAEAADPGTSDAGVVTSNVA